MIDCCNTCQFQSELNGKKVCSYELFVNNGCVEELPEKFWCECFKEDKE